MLTTPPESSLLPYPTLFRSETVRLQEEGRGEDEPPLADEANESGLAAARAEALVERRFAQVPTSDPLRKLSREAARRDRKSTRLNSSHVKISYAVFCLKKKK